MIKTQLKYSKMLYIIPQIKTENQVPKGNSNSNSIDRSKPVSQRRKRYPKVPPTEQAGGETPNLPLVNSLYKRLLLRSLWIKHQTPLKDLNYFKVWVLPSALAGMWADPGFISYS